MGFHGRNKKNQVLTRPRQESGLTTEAGRRRKIVVGGQSASHRERCIKSRRRSTVCSLYVLFTVISASGRTHKNNGIYSGERRSCPLYIGVGSERDARRPVSRVLSRAVARAMAIHLGRPLPDASRDRPGRQVRKPTRRQSGDRRAPPLLGLAPGGVCRAAPVTGRAVRSYRTLSPLLAGLAARGERSPLCGTFPGVAPAGRYPAPCLRGARTFLRRARFRGDGGHPAVWPRLTTPARRPGQAGPAPTRAPTRSSRAAVSASATPSTQPWR